MEDLTTFDATLRFLDEVDYIERINTLLSSGDIPEEKIAYIMSRIVHYNLDDALELFLQCKMTTDEDCRKAFKVALYYESVECIRLLLESGRLEEELIADNFERIRKEPSVVIFNDLKDYLTR